MPCESSAARVAVVPPLGIAYHSWSCPCLPQGIRHVDHFGFICRESSGGGGFHFVCYVFQCTNEALVSEKGHFLPWNLIYTDVSLADFFIAKLYGFTDKLFGFNYTFMTNNQLIYAWDWLGCTFSMFIMLKGLLTFTLCFSIFQKSFWTFDQKSWFSFSI